MKIAVVGLGAYAISIAKIFNENKNNVCMYTKFQDEADIVLLKRENINTFPGYKIPKNIEVISDLETAIKDSKIIVLAVPMFAVRDMAKDISKYLKEDQIICIVSKGIEQVTGKLMSEVIYEETKTDNIAMISGPSFAREMYEDNELGLVVASKKEEVQTAVKVCIENNRIVVNTTKDIVGVQLASVIKNIYAILMGYLDGKGLSDSTKASVLTCLIDDMRVMLELLGGKIQTVFSYAAIGDMLLTCMSKESRNYTFGNYISKGNSVNEALEKMKTATVEGLYSIKGIQKRLKDIKVNIKSIELIHNIIFDGVKVDNILRFIKR